MVNGLNSLTSLSEPSVLGLSESQDALEHRPASLGRGWC